MFVVLVVAPLLFVNPAGGEDIATPTLPVGTLSCSSSSCHGGELRSASRIRSGEEYPRWLHDDPHARAKETLQSERFHEILARLSRREDGEIDPQVRTRCVQCHDPNSVTGKLVGHGGADHGIGCETCHGNAEKWLARHYERDVSRTELLSLGMTDTKDLLARGKLCASCHVGSADGDVNHDLIAAGHPPLRFELSAYHDLIRPKHWDDARPRRETPDYQVQLWAVGQFASTQAALKLLETRCSSDQGNWPEFAEHDCFACHQRIRISPKLANLNRQPGPPVWSNWNLALAAPSSPSLEPLRVHFAQQFPADRGQVNSASAAARRELGTGNIDEVAARKQLFAALLREPASEPSWEAGCQQYLALLAAERTYRDELAKQYSFARLTRAEYNRRLAEHRMFVAELATIRGWLQFEPGLPSQTFSDEPSKFFARRHEISPQIRSLAERLRERMDELAVSATQSKTR